MCALAFGGPLTRLRRQSSQNARGPAAGNLALSVFTGLPRRIYARAPRRTRDRSMLTLLMGGSRAVRSSRPSDELGRDLRDDDAILSSSTSLLAVVCATCGSPDCPDASMTTRRLRSHRDRPLGETWARARCAADGAARFGDASSESLFGALPDGGHRAALRFACSPSSWPDGPRARSRPGGLIDRTWLGRALVLDPGLRDAAVQALLSGIPGLAFPWSRSTPRTGRAGTGPRGAMRRRRGAGAAFVSGCMAAPGTS